MLIEPYQTVSAYVNDSIFNSMRRSWPKTAESRGYLKSDVVERVSHISNEQERDALAALEILKEKFGEEEWSLKSGCLDSCKLRRPNFGAILTSKGEL